jgi:hypothetical protein
MPAVSGSNAINQVSTARAEEAPQAHPMSGSIAMCPYHNALKKGDAGKLREVAEANIKDRVFGDESFVKAEKVLIGALQVEPADKEGRTNHLLGLTYFLQERWGDAIKHLEVAVARNPQNADAAELLKRAKTNAGTGIERAFGPSQPLDGMELLKPPALHLREPQGLKPLDNGQPKSGAMRTLMQNSRNAARSSTSRAAPRSCTTRSARRGAGSTACSQRRRRRSRGRSARSASASACGPRATTSSCRCSGSAPGRSAIRCARTPTPSPRTSSTASRRGRR